MVRWLYPRSERAGQAVVCNGPARQMAPGDIKRAQAREMPQGTTDDGARAVGYGAKGTP